MAPQMNFDHSIAIFRPFVPLVDMNLGFDWDTRGFVEWDRPEYNPPDHELLGWAHVILREDSGRLTIHIEDFESDSYASAPLSSEGSIDVFDPLGASNVTATTWVEVFRPEPEGRYRMRIWADDDPEHLYVAFRIATPAE